MSEAMLLFFFFGVLLLTMAFLSLMSVARIEKGFDFGNKAGLAVTSSVFLGWVLAQCSSSDRLLSNASFYMGFWPFALAALSLSLYAAKKDKINRFWTILAVTVLSVAFLPENLLFFRGELPFVLDRLCIAIIWAVFTNAYVTMDKVEGLTFIQTSALSLSFLLLGILFPVFSPNFACYPLFILASLIGFVWFKRRVPDISLGKTGALPLGYLMGFFMVVMSLEGWSYAFLLMPFYYYFEIIYSRINCFIHRHNPQPKKFTFLVSYAIRENLSNRKVLPFVFLIMLAYGLIGVLCRVRMSMQLSFTFAVALLLCSIYRLAKWNDRSMTYRAMFGVVKDLCKQVNSNVKETVDQISSIHKKNK